MIPTRDEALRLLREAAGMNPGPWEAHSETVAFCAERIAANCGMDADKAYVLGMLHDIGRRFGYSHFAHVVRGYRYMQSLGYDEAAQICLTHSFSAGEISEYVGKLDVPQEDVDEMARLLSEHPMDDYDRLIQLCDTLGGAGEVVDMDARMDDVERRYGAYPPGKREAKKQLRTDFERRCGQDLYALLPTAPVVSRAVEKMIAYYEGNRHDIAHFLKVYAYAKTLGELEGLDGETQQTLELAAIIHDIACPLCRRKHGSATGKQQEAESAALTEPFLRGLGVPSTQAARITLLVSHHHTWGGVDGLDHQLLMEADFLVNADEGGMTGEAIQAALDKTFRSASGKRLLRSIYQR